MKNWHNWDDVKKTLKVTKEGLALAQIKLELSELIYDLRKSKKMSQNVLGKAIGVSQPYIAKIEDGEENLTLETIVKLLFALKTRLDLKPTPLGKSENILHVLRVA